MSIKNALSSLLRRQNTSSATPGTSHKFGFRRAIVGVGALLTFVLALIIPSTAMAIPGSGDFVALYSGSGREITELYNLIAKICLVILIIVEGVLIYAILKFRRRDEDELPAQNHGDLKLEFGWTMAALIIQVWIGVATINVMFSTETEPEDGIEMTVVAEASQWDWDFHYDFPDDDRDPITHPDLVVPAHTNVKLEVTSRDVLHAIFIPDLGVKMDAVPGRFNHWWFRADGPVAQVRAQDFATVERPEWEYPQTRTGVIREGRDATARPVTGLEQRVDFLGESRQVEEISPYAGYSAIEYQGNCAELCGLDHWNMYFRAVVMTQSSFDRWVDDTLASDLEPDGASIYERRCATCHGDDGAGIDPNPTLVGADRVVNPEGMDDHIEIVLQGEGQMPPFAAVLNDAEMVAVINHERVSWGNEGGEIEAEQVAEMREALGLPASPAAAVDPVDTDDLLATGERVYRACASCHGDDGQSFDSDLVPDIAGSSLVIDDEIDELTQVLVQGRDSDAYPGKKSPVARSMTDQQLAGLLTYLRQSFGNDAAEVQPFMVQEVREQLD